MERLQGAGWTPRLASALVNARLFAAATLLYSMAWLALAVPVLALVGGMEPLLISSGSMSPLIREGDVILVAAPGETDVGPGTIITFRDEALSRERLISHRVYAVTDLGYVTKGDANAAPDSDVVHRSAVVGVARVLVPYVGLPSYWYQTGAWLPLLVWSAATLAAVATVWSSLRGVPGDPTPSGGRSSRPARGYRRPLATELGLAVPSPPPARLRAHLAVAVMVAILALTTAFSGATSGAAFTSPTSNAGNVLTAAFWTRVISIAAGESHTCVALGDGSAWCWGRNDKGQLGDNTTTDRSIPVQVTGAGGTGFLSGVTAVTAGQKHSCAVTSAGAMYCWGDNSKGELGDNTTTNRSAPVQVVGVGGSGTLSGVARAAAGLQHTCAALSSGSAWCWGLNDRGQVGDNTTTQRNAPVQVVGAGGIGNLANVSRIAAGSKHTCVALTDASAWCWGLNDKGQLGDNSTTNRSVPVQVVGLAGIGTLANVSRVAAGESHTCVALTTGAAWCWGRNDKGQLGDATTTDRSTPAPVLGVGGIGTLGGAAEITAGNKFACTVQTDGSMRCWGENASGQLGDNSTTQRNTPIQVLGVAGVGTLSSVILAAGGAAHTCAARSDDTVVCWGGNGNGQLGNNTTTDSLVPVVVKGPGNTGTFTNVISIAAGESHTCVALGDGSAWCWGRNDKGQLGDNTTTDRSVPVRVVGVGGSGFLAGAVEVTAGQKHSCAVTGAGAMYCWGDNSKGELGNNTTSNSSSPVQVVGVGGTGTLSGVSHAAAGLQHTCASLTSGAARCWGLNDKGQLGDATTTQRNAPVVVVGVGGTGSLANVDRIAGGSKHTCVVLTTGEARCWGLNDRGQLGDNTTVDRSSPVAVVGLAGVGTLTAVSRVSAGESHTCAARTDGSAWCWGRNDKGQLGDNTTTDRSTPAPVLGVAGIGTLSGVARIAAGNKHSCTVQSDGSMRCWGDNAKGELGDNTTTQRNTPVQVVGAGGVGTFTDAAFAAGGSEHTCAVRTTTRAWCWGLNNNGQLGNGSTSNSSTPVRVL